MKKLIALLLVALMAFSLVACGGSPAETKPAETPAADAETPAADAEAPDADAETPAAAGNVVATPNMNADGSINYDLICNYDPNYDYSQNPQYRVCYMAHSADIMYSQSAECYEIWAGKMNMQWDGFVSAGADSDQFLTNLQTYLDQGTQLFIMDPDMTIYPAIQGIIEPYVEAGEAYWMSQMGEARDWVNITEQLPYGELYRPFAGFEYYGGGQICGETLVNWWKETYPDADISEVGFAALDLSLSPALHDRMQGAYDVFASQEGVTEDQLFIIDTVANGITVQGGLDCMTPVIATHTNLKYWLVFGLIDDTAIGAANACELAGIGDQCAVMSIGGPGFQTQMDAGQAGAYRFCYAIPYLMFAEPIIGALYAQVNGWASADELWPSWVKDYDHGGEGHNYAVYLLPSWVISADNYASLFAWCDMYAGVEYYGYDQTGVSLDDYSPFMEVPEGWNTWQG
ncbi:MAG: hypothetical protein MJ075_06860 [Oscillospiraceae bacterium]|nr:hypothetical protein [Oscillospiraceae bacterium]